MAVNVDIRANIESDFKSGKIDKATYEFKKATLDLESSYRKLNNLFKSTTDLTKLDKATAEVNKLESKVASLKNTVAGGLWDSTAAEAKKLNPFNAIFDEILNKYKELY